MYILYHTVIYCAKEVSVEKYFRVPFNGEIYALCPSCHTKCKAIGAFVGGEKILYQFDCCRPFIGDETLAIPCSIESLNALSSEYRW